MGANQSKIDYASSLKSTATSTTAVPSTNSRRSSTTSTVRRGGGRTSNAAAALPRSSSSNERRQGAAITALSTSRDVDLLEQALSHCTTRNQRHARYNSSSNCTNVSSVMAVADSGYVGSGLAFPLASAITDLGGHVSSSDDAATAQTSSPASVIALTSQWVTNTATYHRLPPPPSYHHRPPLTTYAISVNAVLRDLRRAPQETHTILDRAFETAWQLRDSRDHASAYRIALAWAQEAKSSLNDVDDSMTNASQIASVWVARCRLHGWGVHGQAKDGFELLRDLADHGTWQAFLPLATCYFEGVTTHDGQTVQPVDHALALSWFSTAAQLDPSNYRMHGENNAKQVVAIAQLRVGGMTLKEEEDPRLAFSWFLKSADNDNPYAQFLVAIYYALGHIVPQDMKKVKEYLRKSAEQGFASAQVDLGILLFKEKAYEEAIQWLERAEQTQDTRALYHLGYMYESREGIPTTVDSTISNERAICYFKAAAEQSNVLAQYRLGMHYCDGSLGLQRNSIKAMHYFRQAAQLGYPPAQRRLGLMYLEGLNIPSAVYHAQLQQQKDDGIARAWIEKAALEGRDGQAFVLLGDCYEKGRGIKGGPDINKALDCYWQATQIMGPHQINGFYAHATLLMSQGRCQEAYSSYLHASELAAQQKSVLIMPKKDDLDVGTYRLRHVGRLAQLMVARYALHGWADVTPDAPRAFKILRQLANHDVDIGDEIDYWLAWCYDNNKGVNDESKSMAFKYYRKAAEGKHADSQFQVGEMLMRGIGTDKNLEKAVFWYGQAAKKRHPAANYMLGVLNMYHPHNIDSAITHFERATELGHTEAVERLAKLYQELLAHPTTPSADVPSISGSSPSSSSDKKRRTERAHAILKIITRAADKDNNPVAQRELGRLYCNAVGNPEYHKKAFDLFSKAARQRDGFATVMLGNFYEHGRSVAKDTCLALKHYEQAISFGTEAAFFAAANLLDQLEQFEKAYERYRQAASHPKLRNTPTGKHAQLMVVRYILFEHIKVTTHDKNKAFGMLCALAAEKNFAPAYFWLGDCYHYGRGTPVNLQLAVRWYTDAAEKADNTDAMVRLAYLFSNDVDGILTPDDHLAFGYCSSAVRRGNAEAQYYLGMAYWRGRYGLSIDEAKATELFTASAQKCYGPSHWALGELSYEKGFKDLALRSWDNGSKLNDLQSMRSQAQLLVTLLVKIDDDQERQKPYERAIELFTDAANKGDAESDLYLGRIFSNEAKVHQHKHGLSMKHRVDDEGNDHTGAQDSDDHLQITHYMLQKDKEKAAKFHLERAAHAGLVDPMYHAGEIWYEQENFEADYPFYDKAAERGHTLARYKLSITLPGVEADHEGGFRELVQCAEQDRCALAYYTLGQCYERGLGTPADDDQALKWYHRSYESTKDPQAAFQIGSIEARLGRHDHAATWYQLSRFSEHARAHYELGRYYLHSVASPRLGFAVQHLEHAARQNDPDAMYELGSLLLLSNNSTFGVEQQRRGLLWLEQAATRCVHIPSIVLLGELYRTGKDYYPVTADALGLDTDHMVTVVPVQLERAFDLFNQAAKLDDKTAILHVGTFYEHGIGMPANVTEAKAWYELAQGAECGWAAQQSLARLLHHHFKDERLRAYQLFESAFASAKTDEERRESNIYISRYHLFGYHGNKTDARQQKAAMDTLLCYGRRGEACVYYDIARAYEEGLGVPCPDIERAVGWYARLEDLATNLTPEQENLLDKDLRQNITDALERSASIYRKQFADTSADCDRADALEEHVAQRRRRAAL